MLEKTVRINALFDFYQLLLTDKQQKYVELYFLDDYSLGEIAEWFNVSRQAVFDNIKRTEAMLEEYEQKLGLYSKYIARSELYEKIKTDSAHVLRYVEQLETMEEGGISEWHLKD
ncbi:MULTISPECIES: putative DNA-binding protein [Sinobaca]|uniref:UPF0122 protein ATL39_1097 n=1 Tax=Sinobaca qinghaiensis TaxID=342944 RepID=A0A419V628_9BACL|nr:MULTISPECIES: putative DNA-binding protein [Sinobaca]RKD75398.1 hypothetical protein ATL39_1097 [Sinobaca qinghaiensis]